MKNVEEVTKNFKIPGYIRYVNEYLIDVPETEVNKGHEGVLVTLYTVDLEDNNEANAQIIAEAHCYNISLDEYFNEELGGLAINRPYDDIDISFYYIIDYGKHRKVVFEDYLALSKKMINDLNDRDGFILLAETEFLLKELPKKYLKSDLKPNQVIDRIKYNIYDDALKGELSYYDAHKIFYSLVVNFDYQGNWNFPLNNINNVENYWYIVRGILGKGNFKKVSGLPSKPLVVDCGNGKVLLDHRIDPTFRIGIFDEQNKQLFNSRFMKQRMRVEGKFSLTCGDVILAEFDGNYIIYEHEGLYAAVKRD